MIRNRVVRNHNIADTPDDGEFVDSGSIRGDRLRSREGSAIAGHHTRESFMRAACFSRPPLPPDPDPAATRRALLRAFEEKYGPEAVSADRARAADAKAEALRTEGRARAAGNRVYHSTPPRAAISGRSDSMAGLRGSESSELLDDPQLATDAEIRRATRTGREQ